MFLSVTSLIFYPVNLSLTHEQSMFKGTPKDLLLKNNGPEKKTYNIGFFPANKDVTLWELLSGTPGVWRDDDKNLSKYESFMQGTFYYDYDRMEKAVDRVKEYFKTYSALPQNNCHAGMDELKKAYYDQLIPKK